MIEGMVRKAGKHQSNKQKGHGKEIHTLYVRNRKRRVPLGNPFTPTDHALSHNNCPVEVYHVT